MTHYQYPLPDAPDQLVTDGKFNMGRYKSPFKEVNPLDAKLGIRPRWWKYYRLKEWQHFALVSADYYISLAVFNVKKIAIAQVCIQDIRSNAIYFYESIAPSWKMKVPFNLQHDECSFHNKGFAIEIANSLDNGEHNLSFDIAAQNGLPAVNGLVTLHDDCARYNPMEVCLPLSGGPRAMYSHKNICPLSGDIQIGENIFSVDASNSYGLSDIHKGYYPYYMSWHWGTGGKVQDDKLYGFNLTNNQVLDQEQFNENCFWHDGELHSLPPVVFDFDPKNPLQPWHIHDKEGNVDIIFTPEVMRKIDKNYIILHSKYHGPYGLFNGKISIPDDGIDFELKDFRGMCEDFYLRC